MLVVFGTLISCLSFHPLHPIHISRVSLFHNAETGSLEVAMMIYSDDLETSIRPEGFPPLNIGLENEHPATDSLLVPYLADKFVLKTGDQQVGLFYLGREQKEEATWMYLVAPQFEKPEVLSIHYAVLMNLYNDQKNILTWIAKDKTGLLFTIDDQFQQLEL